MSATLPLPAIDPHRMTPFELRTSAWLASLFALRRLGLFLILPVFAVYARELPGGESTALIGLAMGIYGLTQGVLQIPFGWASDRWGRKPVMTVGLILFAIGSFVCAYADTLTGMIVGRAIQGSGAISAAVTATIADHTRDEVRTKAMAMVGGSIAVVQFALPEGKGHHANALPTNTNQSAWAEVLTPDLLLLSLVGFAFLLHNAVALVALLFTFFVAFNILESIIPSLVSRQAPPARKGLALGVYNTTQTLGLFVGGALGGLLTQKLGDANMFFVCAGASLAWLIICWQMKAPPKRAALTTS